MEISKFVRSFLSESPTPNGLPKRSFIMAYKAMGLRVDVYQYHLSSYGKLDKWEKLFTDLLALSTGSTYSLALFIRFGGVIYWNYLVALFIQ